MLRCQHSEYVKKKICHKFQSGGKQNHVFKCHDLKNALKSDTYICTPKLYVDWEFYDLSDH